MRIAIVTHSVRHNDGQGRVNYEVARAALAETWGMAIFPWLEKRILR